MKTFRIQRKRKTNAQMMIAWGNLLTLIFRCLVRPQIEANRSYMEELKAEEIKTRIHVQQMREAKLANDLVLQDMAIEIKKHEMKQRGITGESFTPAP